MRYNQGLYKKALIFIQNDHLDEAIDLLLAHESNHEIIALSARFKSHKAKIIRGTKSDKASTLERNEIRDCLFTYCDRFKNGFPKNGVVEGEPIGRSDGSDVLVETQTLEIEIKINRDFSSYSMADQEKLLAAIKNLLEINSDINIKRMREGSVLLTLELTPEQCERLHWAIQRGEFDRFDIVNSIISPIASLDTKPTEFVLPAKKNRLKSEAKDSMFKISRSEDLTEQSKKGVDLRKHRLNKETKNSKFGSTSGTSESLTGQAYFYPNTFILGAKLGAVVGSAVAGPIGLGVGSVIGGLVTSIIGTMANISIGNKVIGELDLSTISKMDMDKSFDNNINKPIKMEVLSVDKEDGKVTVYLKPTDEATIK